MKYKIKSYHYDLDDSERRVLFTLEERGVVGESRKYADEIISSLKAWQNQFSADDAKKISYAVKLSKAKKPPYTTG